MSAPRRRDPGLRAHPFLASLLVVLNLVASNPALFAPAEAWRPIVILWLACATIMAITGRFLERHTAAVVATWAVAGFAVPWTGVPALVLHFGLLAALALLLRRVPGHQITTALNLALTAMLLVPISSIARQAWSDPDASATAPPPGPFAGTAPLAGTDALPSIVHIVLDGYGGRAALQSVMGFDNASFVRELRQLGFSVAEDARAPYNQTLPAMASIFYGDYLPAGTPPLSLANPVHIRKALGRLVTDGPIHEGLRTAGYQLLFTDTGYGFFRYPSDARVAKPPLTPNPLELLLIDRYPLETALTATAGLTGRAHAGAGRHRRLVDHALTNTLYSRQPGPFFLYEHVIAPHPPFNVTPDGAPTDRWLDVYGGTADGDHSTHGLPVRMAAYRQGYLAKLAYVNAAVLRQVGSMIREIPAPKVIVVHGDHGSGLRFFHDDRARTCLNERFSTLLAVYSDDPAIRAAFAGIESSRPNIVNLYRMLYDARFGTSLGLLEDRSYFVRWSAPHAPELLPDRAMAEECTAAPLRRQSARPIPVSDTGPPA